MTLVLIFLAALLGVSGFLYLCAKLTLRADPRVEQWPLFWATGLILSVLIPLSGVTVLMMPDWARTPAIEFLSLHEPLQSLGLVAGPKPVIGTAPIYFTLANAAMAIAFIYGVGIMLSVVKLSLGRLQIRRLIATAGPLGDGFEDDVLVSPNTNAPFAWTPFGQPKYARIVIPGTYRREMDRSSLTDILIHERAHIHRRDDECGLILRVILCVAWVSPFARCLFERWSQSTELHCDMAVTANRDPQMRKRYADTLLQAIHIMAGRVRQYPAASFSTHRIRNEKMRITHIMNGTRPVHKRARHTLGLAFAASTLTILGAFSISTMASAQEVSPQSIKLAESNQTKSPSALKPSVMVTGRLSSTFGTAPDPFKKGSTRNHWGVDVAAPIGTPIYSPADGVIMAATDSYNGNPKYGNVVALQTDGGMLTVFAHLDGYTVRTGQRVTKGTEIATVGNSGKSTGPHVHIETYRNGSRVDPASVWDISLN